MIHPHPSRLTGSLLLLLALGVMPWSRLLAADVSSTAATSAGADDEFSKQASWQPPAAQDVRNQIFAWLAEQYKDDQSLREDKQKQADALWPANDKTAGGVDLLEHVARIIALGHPAAKSLVQECFQPRRGVVLPKHDVLSEEKLAPLARNNLRLAYGRWLAQERLYDESIVQLNGLQTGDVVDPASLLFYQSVGYHYLLNKDEGLKSLAKLMERQKELPRRYVAMAELMQKDLIALKDESLDHISRRMDDVKRRLDLGRTGQKVRGEEDGIIASLDKLIDELEKKQQQQQQQQSPSKSPAGGKIKPANESKPSELKGPGEVTNKNIGHKSGWGDLPPKQREEAMQQIGKEFPSHYREIIEQYFRKMAAEESEDK